MSEISRPSADKRLMEWFDSIEDSEIYFSALTVMERRKGIEKMRNDKPTQASQIDAALTEILTLHKQRIICVDEIVAHKWGGMLARKEKHIFNTGNAAVAAAHELILVTLNESHYDG